MAEGTAVTCESRETLIALRVEGDLEPAEVARLEAHLAACARCRDFAEELTRSQEALKELADTELDPAVLAAVRCRVRESLDRPRRSSVPTWALTAAAAVAIVALLVARRTDTPPAATATLETRPTEVPTATAIASVAPPRLASTERAPMPSTPRLTRRPPGPARRPTMTLEPPLPAAPDGAAEGTPAVVKLTTSDPDVVIYWVLPGSTKDETETTNGGQS